MSFLGCTVCRPQVKLFLNTSGIQMEPPKSCSPVTYINESNFKNWFFGNKSLCSHFAFAFSRTGQLRSRNNQNVESSLTTWKHHWTPLLIVLHRNGQAKRAILGSIHTERKVNTKVIRVPIGP